MKKFYHFILFSLLAAFAISAQEESTCLTLNFTDGAVVKFSLTEKPVMTFGDSDFTVKSDGIDYTYSRADLTDFNFTQGHSSAVADISADCGYNISVIAPALFVISAGDISGVNVYDLNGRLVAAATASGQAITIDLSGEPSGVYLVEIPGHKSFKVAK